MSAQPRGWEAAGGYQLVDDPQIRVTLRGWSANAGVAIRPWLWAVVDAGNAGRTVEFVELREFAAGGGARVQTRVGPFVEFAQLTAGVARSGSTVFGETSADTAFALQPGLGFDLPMGTPGRWRLRLQIDRRVIFGGQFVTDDRHHNRLAASLVFAPRPFK